MENLYNVCVQNYLRNLIVKEFCKLVYSCRSYVPKSNILFFDSQCSSVASRFVEGIHTLQIRQTKSKKRMCMCCFSATVPFFKQYSYKHVATCLPVTWFCLIILLSESPRSLSHLCRLRIRRCFTSQQLLTDDAILSLPLPVPILDYLLYNQST